MREYTETEMVYMYVLSLTFTNAFLSDFMWWSAGRCLQAWNCFFSVTVFFFLSFFLSFFFLFVCKAHNSIYAIVKKIGS